VPQQPIVQQPIVQVAAAPVLNPFAAAAAPAAPPAPIAPTAPAPTAPIAHVFPPETAVYVAEAAQPEPAAVPTAPPAPAFQPPMAPAPVTPYPVAAAPAAPVQPEASPQTLGDGTGAASPWRSRATTPASVPGLRAARAAGEDLLAYLFESMHELNFARDAVDGGNFCLQIAMEKLPSLAGIVLLYDINHREFLVSNTHGADADKLLLRRFPETDPLLALAMRRRRAIVVAEAGETEAASNERYVTVGGARSLIVAPVMKGGRFLGAIELINPLDGQPFTEAEGNAMTYIGEQFAEFVAARGVVTDPERISYGQDPRR
jgi:hypothetical protein